MLYRFFIRILRRQMVFHLIIPLLCGFLAEEVYRRYTSEEGFLGSWQDPADRIALLLGIVVAYFVVIAIQVWRETNIGIQQSDLNELAEELRGAKSLFAVGAIQFSEWFDPAVQVYLATIGEQKLRPVPPNPPFRYERVLFITGRSARKDLGTDYIDGHYAKCLIQIHQRQHIDLYFLEWNQIEGIIDDLTKAEKIAIGYYPKFFRRISQKNAQRLIWLVRRKRVRHMAAGIIEPKEGPPKVFLYSKHKAIVRLHFIPPGRTHAWEKLVSLVRAELLDQETGKVHGQYDFLHFFTANV